MTKTEAKIAFVEQTHRATAMAIAGRLIRRPSQFAKRLEVAVLDIVGHLGGTGRDVDTGEIYPMVSYGLLDYSSWNRSKWFQDCRAGRVSPTTASHREAIDLANRDLWVFVEYHHINEKPGIGKFTSDDPIDHINAIVAHELAHAIVFWNDHKAPMTHGKDWQAVYKKLRGWLDVPES